MTDYIYDVETYPNIFTMSTRCVETGNHWQHEISHARNDVADIVALCRFIQQTDGRMVGFNNVGFDYPVLHFILENADIISVVMIFDKAQSIINCDWNARHFNRVPEFKHYVRQVDLFLIHHFDNDARRTSLKMIEFAQRSQNIGDLPFPVGVPIPDGGAQMMHDYNAHDTLETLNFYRSSADHLQLRQTMVEKHGLNCTNFSSSKIGKEFFIKQLPQEYCYYHDERGKRQPRQTLRLDGVKLNDVIFPYVQFKTPEFNRVLNWLRTQTIMPDQTKGFLKDVIATVGGIDYKFGTGGMHASMTDTIAREDDTHCIIDVDVKSFYPNLAIANNLYPEHMGPEFCVTYKNFYDFRGEFKKGTAENTAIKLGLNSVYGDSNNPYSPFYDPQYTMSITVNGQLLLCMLAEYMLDIPDCTILQVNTDGLTIRLPRNNRYQVGHAITRWEKMTGLELEQVDYSAMFIRDVNSYMAVKKDGGIKRIGAYQHGIDIGASKEVEALQMPLLRNYKGEKEWHQDHGAYVIALAAERYLIDGVSIEHTIMTHGNALDFMFAVKATKTYTVYIDDESQQKVTRCYVSTRGGEMYKFGGKKNNKVGIMVGWQMTECNNLDTFTPGTINALYYIKEAEKLVQLKELT